MGGDDYVITINSKHTDAHTAAHDLDAQVTALRAEVARLRDGYRRIAGLSDLKMQDGDLARDIAEEMIGGLK